MSTRHPWIAASLGALALVIGPAAAAQPGPDSDPERIPERVTGVPRPAGPVPAQSPSGASRGAAVPDSTLATRLQSRSAPLVPAFGGQVRDVGSGDVIWSRGASTGLRPASATKVLTALSATQILGAGHRFRTDVEQVKVNPDRVYLTGGGDPTLSTPRLQSMARTTAARLTSQGISSVALRVDDSLFPEPTNAVGWEDEDVPQYVAPVRALVVDQKNSMDTSMQAARVYADALETNGISVRSTTRKKAPQSTNTITYRSSPQLRTIVADMLRESNNDYAEALLWTSGLAAGAEPTWAGMTGQLKAEAQRYGVPKSGMRLYDGSGLSRSNRISATSLSTLMATLYTDPAMKRLVFADHALPIAGRTGTLENRFGTSPSSCAVDKVRGKTGSLRDTTVLTGIAVGDDGRTRAFSFQSGDRDNTAAVRRTIDELAATTVTCM